MSQTEPEAPKIRVTATEYKEILKKECNDYWIERSKIPDSLYKKDPDEYWQAESVIRQRMDTILDQYEVIPIEVNHPNPKNVKLIQATCDSFDGIFYTGSILNLNTFADSDNLYSVLSGIGNWSFTSGDALNQKYLYSQEGEPQIICEYSEGDLCFRIPNA
jgi:hypothetical protein